MVKILFGGGNPPPMRSFQEVLEMYMEFIIIYAGLAVLLIMMIVVLILLIKLLRNQNISPRSVKPYQAGGSTLGSGSMAFCKNCATSFDASLHVCPKCGTPR